MCCGREMGLPSVQEGGSGTEETPSDCTYGFSKRSAQKNERQRDLRKAPVSRQQREAWALPGGSAQDF